MKKSSKILVLALIGVLCLNCLIAPVEAATSKSVRSFADFEDDWYTKAMQNALDNGLLTGYWDNTIQPQGNITRAEVATILSKALAATEKADLSQFADADKNEWYYDFLAKAVNMQVMSGNGYGFVMPNDNITREEAATVIARTFCYTASKEDVLAKFPDADEVSDWAKPYVEALVENGIMAGIYGKLEPKKEMTRAEFAQIMSNITNDYITSAKKAVTTDFDGSVVVKVPGVTLKDMTIEKDLIVADGVGKGDFTMENVVVNGNLVIRGGGVNSIKIMGKSKVKGRIITSNRNGKVRLYSQEAVLEEIEVLTPVILDCDVESVTINEETSVEVRGFVQEMVANESAEITGKGTVQSLEVNEEGATITGNADVKDVLVNEDNVTVDIPKANVTAAEGTENVKAGTKDVEAGESETVKSSTSTSGGSSSGSSSSSISTKNLAYTITENANSYTLAKNANNDAITDFQNTQYSVTVKFLDSTSNPIREDEVATIKSSSEAISLAKRIFGSLDLEKLLNTIDNKSFVTSNADYENYRNELTVVFAVMFADKYDAIDNARRVAANTCNGGDLTTVKLSDIYTTYLANEGKTEADVRNEINAALDNLAGSSFYSDAIWDMVTDSSFMNKIF